jgi:uncharacterized protein DUF2380
MDTRTALALAIALIAPTAGAQSVAVFPSALYNKQANVIEATDSSRAVLATQEIRARFATDLGTQLIDPRRVDSASTSPTALAAAGEKPCNVIVACARAVGKALGAQWVVMSKVSKTSNLIWLLSGQLVNVATGKLEIDDSTELKGDPTVMVPAGVRIFADRVTKRIRGATQVGAVSR